VASPATRRLECPLQNGGQKVSNGCNGSNPPVGHVQEQWFNVRPSQAPCPAAHAVHRAKAAVSRDAEVVRVGVRNLAPPSGNKHRVVKSSRSLTIRPDHQPQLQAIDLNSFLDRPVTPTLLSTGGCRSEVKRAARGPRTGSIPTNLPSCSTDPPMARLPRFRASMVRDWDRRAKWACPAAQ